MESTREAVRARYAAAARVAAGEEQASCCGPQARGRSPTSSARSSARASYAAEERGTLPDTAVLASLGCGNPTAVAELHEGETVLDLGSGGGIDVLLSARRVGPAGKAYGLDKIDEMLALARRNQLEAGVENVEWLKGDIEAIPLAETPSTWSSPTASSTSPATRGRCSARPRASSGPAGASPSPTSIADPDMDAATKADMAAIHRLHRRRAHP